MAQPAHGQLHNLTTLIKRLEAATSRLEDLATIVPPSTTVTNIAPAQPAAAPQTTLQPAPPPEPLPPSIEDFDDLINGEVAEYVKLSKAIGGLVEEQSMSVQKCFAAQRRFLIITTKAKKPDKSSQLFVDLIAGMQENLTQVSNLFETNRHSPFSSHLQTVGEGASALAWVTVDSRPGAFLDDMIGAAQYWGNRVLNAYKGKEQKHVDWVKAAIAMFVALREYVKKHHKMGVVWNANGVDASELLDAPEPVSSPVSAAPSITGGAPPPPPPPPGPPPVLNFDGPSSPAPSSSGGDLGGVFAELNRGEAVTAGLRKVDRSQMTHKNPELRASSVVPARTNSSGSLRAKSPAPPSKPKPASLTRKKPPKKELEGSKWLLEHFENDSNIIVDQTDINHSVFIFRCKNVTIQVKGKINQISIHECVKVNVVADSLVSSIDVIKSNKFAIQVLQQIPTIQVDQCDDGTIYIPRDSPNCEVFTSKSTAVNVYIPGPTEDDDYAECAVPEQFKHTIKDGKLVSEIVEHAG